MLKRPVEVDKTDVAEDEVTDVAVVLASVVVDEVVSSKTGNSAPTDTNPAKFDKLGPAAGQKHLMLSVSAVTK